MYNPSTLTYMKDQEFTRQFVQKLNPPVFENVSRREWQKDLYKTHNYDRRDTEPRSLLGQLITAAAIIALLVICYGYSNELQDFFDLGKEVVSGR